VGCAAFAPRNNLARFLNGVKRSLDTSRKQYAYVAEDFVSKIVDGSMKPTRAGAHGGRASVAPGDHAGNQRPADLGSAMSFIHRRRLNRWDNL
jgi:hypothetical protein